jgi:hypothetical protein
LEFGDSAGAEDKLGLVVMIAAEYGFDFLFLEVLLESEMVVVFFEVS